MRICTHPFYEVKEVVDNPGVYQATCIVCELEGLSAVGETAAIRALQGVHSEISNDDYAAILSNQAQHLTHISK